MRIVSLLPGATESLVAPHQLRTLLVRAAAAWVGALWLASSLVSGLPWALVSLQQAVRESSPQAAELAAGTPPAAVLLEAARAIPSRAAVSVVSDQPPDGYSYYWVSYWLSPRTVAFESAPRDGNYALLIGKPGDPLPPPGARPLVLSVTSGSARLAVYAPATS